MVHSLKIAIIGAGLAGLACAIECERLGIIPDVFERDESVGWLWPSISIWFKLFEREAGDPRNHLRDIYNLDLKPLTECRIITMKSPNHETRVEGDHGSIYLRGKRQLSIENQLLGMLERTPVHYNHPADYKELSQKYDHVVVATAKDTAAKELGVWEDIGRIHIRGGIALGSFTVGSGTVYFNTHYAGQGFARIVPFNSTQATVELYNIGCDESQADSMFTRFIELEGLAHLEFLYKFSLPVFSTGHVKKFKVENILLAGCAAGLTDRLLGTGAFESIISGVLAARSMIRGLEYDTLIKPIQDHIENLSALRKPVEKLDNQGFDRLVSILDTPGIKQVIYNTGINFTDAAGAVLKRIYQ